MVSNAIDWRLGVGCWMVDVPKGSWGGVIRKTGTPLPQPFPPLRGEREETPRTRSGFQGATLGRRNLPMKPGAPAPLPASCPWNFSPARVPALPETARGFRGSMRETFGRNLSAKSLLPQRLKQNQRRAVRQIERARSGVEHR